MSYPWERPRRDTWPDMNYLLSEAAQARYVLAAHHLGGCDTLLEIGGFKTPITAFAGPGVRRVLVVDPKIEAFEATSLHGRPCRVQHRRARFQDLDYADLAPGYGFALLGYSVKYFSDEPDAREREWALLVGLVRRSAAAVLEYAVRWPLGAASVARLIEDSGLRIAVDLQIELGASPGVDTEHGLRRYLLLRPGTG